MFDSFSSPYNLTQLLAAKFHGGNLRSLTGDTSLPPAEAEAMVAEILAIRRAACAAAGLPTSRVESISKPVPLAALRWIWYGSAAGNDVQRGKEFVATAIRNMKPAGVAHRSAGGAAPGARAVAPVAASAPPAAPAQERGIARAAAAINARFIKK